jgi:hypothetical protein
MDFRLGFTPPLRRRSFKSLRVSESRFPSGRGWTPRVIFSCSQVNRSELRVEQNTHGTELSQRPSLVCGCCEDPTTGGDNRSCWKLGSKTSLNPDTVLNQNKGVTATEQGGQNIWSRYHIWQGSVKPSVLLDCFTRETAESR